ncbi:MAG TPA: NAD(P)/FAD-dependent oxidoreductase [Chloroflexota bacterium]|nr:NAD(P)/FAD-dependent oxidoreductase [Chloroflexota bacterium]
MASTAPSSRRRVLILGGGFAGIYTALGLEHAARPEEQVEVTLISRDNYFLFTPMLCEVISSQIDTTHAINPIRRMFRRTRFVEGEVRGIDVQAHTVTVRYAHERQAQYPYDHLVVAVGATTGFFGMHDVQEHAITAKTLGDAIYLRNWALEMLELASVEQNPATRAELLTFVVGGGGFTGVEVAGELNDLVRRALPSYPAIAASEVRVMLVEARSRLLPEFSQRLAAFATGVLRSRGVEVRAKTSVAGATAREVRLKDADPIPTRTLVWTSGVAPHAFVAHSGLPTDEKGWITVDAHLRAPGVADVWALGDCAHIPDVLHPGKFQPALAQHAIREAHQLARNILATMRDEPTQPFRYRTMGQMATLGHYNGIGTIGPLQIAGLPAWLLWRTYYLWRMPRLEKRLRIATDWTVDALFGRDISQIQTYRASEVQELDTQQEPTPASGGPKARSQRQK